MNIAATRRMGFTLMELLIVVSIISVLAMLLMPALSSALMSAKMQFCANNQRQAGLQLSQYSGDFYGSFPCADYSATLGGGLVGWSMHLINTGYPAFPPRAAEATSLLFRCPADELMRMENDGVTPSAVRHSMRLTYSANIGWDATAANAGPLYSLSGNVMLSRKVAMLSQPSRTIAYCEMPWVGKRMEYNLTSALFLEVSSSCKGTDFASANGLYYTSLLHPGGTNFLFCDGHVAPMPWANASVQRALWTAAGD